MNIFSIYLNPEESARELIDAHVIKMTLESAQILCTVAHLNGLFDKDRIPYKPTHVRHPSVRWAGETCANFYWLYNHFVALCNEYFIRYQKRHKCSQYKLIFESMVHNFERKHGHGQLTPFATAMPEHYKIRLPNVIPIGIKATIEREAPVPIFMNQFNTNYYMPSRSAVTVRFEEPYPEYLSSSTFIDPRVDSRASRGRTVYDECTAAIWSYRNYYYNEKIDKVKMSGIGGHSYHRQSKDWLNNFNLLAEDMSIAIAPPVKFHELDNDPLTITTRRLKLMRADRLTKLISAVDCSRGAGRLLT